MRALLTLRLPLLSPFTHPNRAQPELPTPHPPTMGPGPRGSASPSLGWLEQPQAKENLLEDHPQIRGRAGGALRYRRL